MLIKDRAGRDRHQQQKAQAAAQAAAGVHQQRQGQDVGDKHKEQWYRGYLEVAETAEDNREQRQTYVGDADGQEEAGLAAAQDVIGDPGQKAARQ